MEYGIICAKGRVKWSENRLPSLLEQPTLRPFDERSDPGKPKVFRGMPEEKLIRVKPENKFIRV